METRAVFPESSPIIPGGTLTLDAGLKIIQVSPALCQVFGCPTTVLEGDMLENLFSPKDRKGMLRFHEQLSRDRSLDLVVVLRIQQQDYVSRLRMHQVDDQWQVLLENILAEGNALFRELFLERERWTSIVRNSSEGIAILDAAGHLTEFNSRFFEAMQFRSAHGVPLNEEAIAGKQLFDLSDHDGFQTIQTYFDAAKLKKKARLNLEIQYHQAYFHIEVNPIYLPVQGFAGCSLVVKEITLQKQLEQQQQELQAAHQEITALNRKLAAENLRMTTELDLIRQMQHMILPRPEELEHIEGLDIAGFMESAQEVGGDYYDVLHKDGVVTIGIGDVTGHGLESGILMVMTQTAVRTLKEIRETDPVRFLDALNRTIYQNVQRMDSDKNLTLAVLNYAEGLLSVSGQHEETLVIRASGAIERIDTVDLGFPIGLDDEIESFIDRTVVQLEPGDGIVLYTDGITEAENIQGELYGLEKLCAVVQQQWTQSAEEVKTAVIGDLRQHIGTQKVFDDITLLVIKRYAAS